jgi:hypothetical protein
MNYRFFHKRAFYLAVIAKHVTDPKCHLNVDARYESKRGDPRLTMLILRPKHGAAFPILGRSLTTLTVLQTTPRPIFRN